MWNCNGSLWTRPDRLEELTEDHDFICITETHESPERGLPDIAGFGWESAFRATTRRATSRGSGGVAILFRRSISSHIQIVSRDEEARFIWVRLEIDRAHWVYIAICYFPPRGSSYASIDGQARVGDSPYTSLSDDILRYSALGEVFLMGDFNGRTQTRQCELYDMDHPEIMSSLDPEEMEISRLSADTGQDTTGYGSHLLELGSRHHLVIYNGMRRWPDSSGLTCFPHGGGESTVDYILGSLSGAQLLRSFSIGRRPIGADHTFLTFTLTSHLSHTPTPTTQSHTTIHFTHELSHVYAHHLHTHLLSLDPQAPLDSLTSDLTSIIHTSAILSFPHHTRTHAPRTGSMPRNS